MVEGPAVPCVCMFGVGGWRSGAKSRAMRWWRQEKEKL